MDISTPFTQKTKQQLWSILRCTMEYDSLHPSAAFSTYINNSNRVICWIAWCMCVCVYLCWDWDTDIRWSLLFVCLSNLDRYGSSLFLSQTISIQRGVVRFQWTMKHSHHNGQSEHSSGAYFYGPLFVCWVYCCMHLSFETGDKRHETIW